MNNRLQKKCVIAATSFHVGLLAILLFGSAFFSGKQNSDDRPPIDFIPTKAIDELLSGGGSPRAGAPVTQPPPELQPPTPPAPAEPTPPQPKPPEVVKLPDPPKTAPREVNPLAPVPKKKLPEVSTRPVTRPKDNTTKKSSPNNSDPQADAKAQQQRIAKAIAGATSAIRSGTSGSTEVELPAGTGGGGPSYAPFLDVVKKVYTDAWIVPDDAADDDSTVVASVTIAKSGKVVASKITRASSNAQINASVQRTLDRVPFVIALPEGAKESERTVTIKFNARIKRGLG